MSVKFSPLPHEALLQVNGPDAASFLQGQTTCDVREIDDQRARPGAWCTPQGRALADFLLVQRAPEHFLLRLRADILEPTAERLGKYIVFSKAELHRAEGWQVAACWGSGASAALETVTGALPRERYGQVSGEGFCLVQVDEAGEAFELFLDETVSADMLQQLAASAGTGSPEDWRALEVARGIGRVESATIDTFLPQALNYDHTGFVNFQKGCYTGQEVVARLHYRGKSKRRMYPASSEADTLPSAGETVVTATGKSVGTVVNAVHAPGGNLHLLVSVAEQALAGPLHLGAADGPVLALGELPYSLEATRE